MQHWPLPAMAVTLIAYGAVSRRLRSTPVSQAMVFVSLGLLAGNRVLGLVEVETATQFVRHPAEATLTLVLFCDAIRVNRGRLRRESGLPARLLGAGLPLTIVAGSLVGLVMFPQLNLWTAAALAPCWLPTDAALGLPVVTSPRVPSRIRQALNVESGLNDGVCVPLLIVFLAMAQAEEGTGHIEPVRVVVEALGFGATSGAVAGTFGAWLLRTFGRRGWDRGDLAGRRDRGAAQLRHLPTVRGRAARSGNGCTGLADRRPRGREPHPGSDAAGGSGHGGHRHASVHRRVPGLVRAPGAGLDRVRADAP